MERTFRLHVPVVVLQCYKTWLRIVDVAFLQLSSSRHEQLSDDLRESRLG